MDFSRFRAHRIAVTVIYDSFSICLYFFGVSVSCVEENQIQNFARQSKILSVFMKVQLPLDFSNDSNSSHVRASDNLIYCGIAKDAKPACPDVHKHVQISEPFPDMQIS